MRADALHDRCVIGATVDGRGVDDQVDGPVGQREVVDVLVARDECLDLGLVAPVHGDRRDAGANETVDDGARRSPGTEHYDVRAFDARRRTARVGR